MDLKDYSPVPIPPTMDTDTSPQARLLKALSKLAMNAARVGTTTSLGNVKIRKKRMTQSPVFWFS